MRPVRAVGLYLALVFLGGALIAPWVYALVQSASGFLPGLQALAAKPFPRYVNRSFLILGLAGLWPFLRATGLSSARSIGLGRRPDWLSQIGWGFLFGLISLACGPATDDNATQEQIGRIKQRLQHELDAGALGIGMGIQYTPTLKVGK